MGASAGGVRAGKAYVELYSDNNRLTRGLAAGESVAFRFRQIEGGYVIEEISESERAP